MFLDPVPAEPALMRCYQPGYFGSGGVSWRVGPGRAYQVSSKDIDAGKVRGYTDVVANFQLARKSVLEVGCATGALLQALRQHSPSMLIGIDIAAEQVAYGRQHYGLDLRCGKLEEAGLPAAQFDLIIMLDVIEHASDTGCFFSAAVSCLRPGGAIFIRTPNADSYWVARQRWNYLFCGLEHVAYLSKTSLQFLAAQYGMVLEHIETTGCPASLPYAHRHSLARILLEPITVLGNRAQRRKLASAIARGCGLDMYATLRKVSSDPVNGGATLTSKQSR
jgi:2-polyprenyl-3-methyl-5-hydroxy-6-metoxy-1,4-benzoquinol methylase